MVLLPASLTYCAKGKQQSRSEDTARSIRSALPQKKTLPCQRTSSNEVFRMSVGTVVRYLENCSSTSSHVKMAPFAAINLCARGLIEVKTAESTLLHKRGTACVQQSISLSNMIDAIAPIAKRCGFICLSQRRGSILVQNVVHLPFPLVHLRLFGILVLKLPHWVVAAAVCCLLNVDATAAKWETLTSGSVVTMQRRDQIFTSLNSYNISLGTHA